MPLMKILFLATLLFLSVPVLAQHGGKAEPSRIRFAIRFNPETSSATVRGALSPGEEQEYVFAAKSGQTVTIKNPSRLFDFRVFSEENFPDGDFDSSPTYSFVIPADGDYNFFIRRKVGGPKRASFRMTITIK